MKIPMDHVLFVGLVVRPWYQVCGLGIRHGGDGSVIVQNDFLREADGLGYADRHELHGDGTRTDLAPDERPPGYVGLRRVREK